MATVPNPAKYEKLAADELVAYLERISGKRLKQLEIGKGVEKVSGAVPVIGS